MAEVMQMADVERIPNSKFIAVKVSPELAAAIKVAAAEEDRTVSQWLRLMLAKRFNLKGQV